MRDDRWWRRAGLAGIALVAALFALLNSGERVALNLGAFTLYRIPLVALILLAFVLGMVTMFLLGLRHDLRTRQLLREHNLIPGPTSVPERAAVVETSTQPMPPFEP